MGQKTNPVGFRVAVTKDWLSKWYADKRDYAPLLLEDIQIRDIVKRKLASAAVPKVAIERYANRARITIFTARPGIVIGRKGAEIDKLKAKAYILSCGVECGGAAANVSVVDMTTTPPTPGTMQAVPGATVGLLNANSLYVAGNSSALPGSGVLTVVDAGTLAPGAPVAIGDGLHRRMALDNHGHLFIGAKACTQLRCLTIFDTGSQSATVEVDPDPTHNGNGFGDVGGIQPISGRDRLYLAQGGELRIFDTIAPQPLPSVQQIDIVGFVQDVVLVDP